MLSSYSDNSTILIYCFKFVTFCQYLSLCAVADINIEMVLCAVATCNSRSGRDKSVEFFAFPKTSKLRKAWVDKCRRKNYKPSEYAKICEHHFVDSDFVMSRAFAASVGFTQKFLLRLKPGAIPTVISESKLTSTPLRKKKNHQESPKLLKNVEY